MKMRIMIDYNITMMNVQCQMKRNKSTTENRQPSLLTKQQLPCRFFRVLVTSTILFQSTSHCLDPLNNKKELNNQEVQVLSEKQETGGRSQNDRNKRMSRILDRILVNTNQKVLTSNDNDKYDSSSRILSQSQSKSDERMQMLRHQYRQQYADTTIRRQYNARQLIGGDDNRDRDGNKRGNEQQQNNGPGFDQQQSRDQAVHQQQQQRRYRYHFTNGGPDNYRYFNWDDDDSINVPKRAGAFRYYYDDTYTHLSDVWLCLFMGLAWMVWLVNSFLKTDWVKKYQTDSVIVRGHVLHVETVPDEDTGIPTYTAVIDYMIPESTNGGSVVKQLQIRKQFETQSMLQQGFANVELLVLPSHPTLSVLKDDWEKQLQEEYDEDINTNYDDDNNNNDNNSVTNRLLTSGDCCHDPKNNSNDAQDDNNNLNQQHNVVENKKIGGDMKEQYQRQGSSGFGGSNRNLSSRRCNTKHLSVGISALIVFACVGGAIDIVCRMDPMEQWKGWLSVCFGVALLVPGAITIQATIQLCTKWHDRNSERNGIIIQSSIAEDGGAAIDIASGKFQRDPSTVFSATTGTAADGSVSLMNQGGPNVTSATEFLKNACFKEFDEICDNLKERTLSSTSSNLRSIKNQRQQQQQQARLGRQASSSVFSSSVNDGSFNTGNYYYNMDNRSTTTATVPPDCGYFVRCPPLSTRQHRTMSSSTLVSSKKGTPRTRSHNHPHHPVWVIQEQQNDENGDCEMMLNSDHTGNEAMNDDVNVTIDGPNNTTDRIYVQLPHGSLQPIPLDPDSTITNPNDSNGNPLVMSRRYSNASTSASSVSTISNITLQQEISNPSGTKTNNNGIGAATGGWFNWWKIQ